jgi:hypothetical protein
VLRVFRLVVCLSPSAVTVSDEGEVTIIVCLEALAALVLIVTAVDCGLRGVLSSLVGVEIVVFSFFSIVLLGVDLSQDLPAHVLLGGCVLRLERRVGDGKLG